MFGGVGNWYYSSLAGLGRKVGSRSWQNLVISPPRDPAIFSQLTYAGASIDSTMGLVSSSWTVPNHPAQGSVCSAGAESEKSLTLTCGNKGKTFTGVAFASYGTPTGSCSEGWAVNPACHANTSMAVVSAACLGKNRCTIPITNGFFGGDPCFDTVKMLAVALSGDCVSGSLYTSNVTVPTGASATVALPATLSPNPTIEEGGLTVWASGAYVPGVPGIVGAALQDDAVVFTVGSGSYKFEVLKS